MKLAIDDIKTPLRLDLQDTIRVGQTRITLDTVINLFNMGSSPEQIAHSFPTLPLDDVYLTLGYYLRNKGRVDEYLAERAKASNELRKEIEARCPPEGLRDRLLARQRARQAADLANRRSVPQT